MTKAFSGFVIAAALAIAGMAANAQDTSGEELPTRYPATGIPVINCAPADPAPTDTCLLRILPGYELQSIEDNLEGSNFSLTAPGRMGFPADLGFSATLILVDLSPGPGGGRRATFETERDLIADIVSGLPQGESVSVYGFNEGLQRLSPFSDNRADALAAVEDLELQGSNTRIGAFVSDGISILAAQDNVLMRNLIVISDGQEEGQVSLDSVINEAIEAEVVISAVGTFWRPVGAADTSLGMDYLRLLTDGTSGLAAQAILRTGDAAQNVADFVASYDAAISASRLIQPIDTPRAAEITVQLGEPALGAPGEFTSRTAVVRYTPMNAQATETAVVEDPVPEPEEPMLLGFPQTYVYGAAGALLALLLLILLLARRGRGKPAEGAVAGGADFDDGDGLDFDDAGPALAPAPPTVAVAKAAAYLVFEDSQRRAGLSSDKNSVGRSATNDVVIEVEGISRLHAQVFRNRDGGFSVTDMDSLNGTFVNGKKVVGTQPVRLGDTLTFGTVKTQLVSA